jgi:TRAP-type C4-dicarboxylate transport system permease small subunit
VKLILTRVGMWLLVSVVIGFLMLNVVEHEISWPYAALAVGVIGLFFFYRRVLVRIRQS